MMKCLIIAAGLGSRLSKKGDSKPLVSLLGLSLIERVILTAKKSGLASFYVVTGYNGEKVRQYLNQFSKSRNINITHIINEEWESGNGISVLKAEELLNENFILLMGDHIFDESILVKLKDKEIADGEVVLAVDYNIQNKLVDANDVTRVLVEEGRILDIGKNIKKYNAYDTGIFLCSPAIFGAIEESLRGGDSTLSGGVKVLADKGKAKTFDITNDYWIDVDDEESLKKAEKQLQGGLIKSADGLISRHINREFSTRIFTPLLLKMHRGITPNQVSILSFIVGLISSLYFFLGYAVIGALFIQISSILDGCDGEIARLKHMQSSLGDFVDAVLDRYADGFILLGIFYYSLIEIGNKEIFGVYWSPLIIFTIFGLAILGNLMVSYTSAKSIANFGYKYKGKLIAAGRGRDLRLFLLFIGGIMTYFHPIFVLFAVIIIATQTNTIVILRTFLSWNYFLNRDSLIRSKVKAVIFDFDGTIANTMPFLTELGVKLMTERYNISKSEAERRYLETTGLDFASQLELIFPDHPNNQEVANTFESKKIEGIFANPIFPEVIPTLKYFSNKKIKTFICSSTKQEIITKYAQLNRIDKQVDGLFGKKSDFGKSEQIDFVIQHHNLHPNEVLFVGDSLKDNDFAKDKKINFIGISMIFDRIEFQKRGALSVSCLADIVELFDQSEKYFKSLEEVK
ncbi:MAG: HAD hydrolase-like protein [Methanosarcinales archaeon]|uniref:Bifunctional IPC transferase and DIPP synthase n=1 Tax=Candidatus Ethanoperedens thermophilum TaxID=2766897 RepID=A0A848D957_9EURY|nr:HAD hydrolase-like protein [Candidatus Ethanoperedens thermophilum]